MTHRRKEMKSPTQAAETVVKQGTFGGCFAGCQRLLSQLALESFWEIQA